MKTVMKFNRPETLPEQSQWLASPTPEQLARTLAINIADQLRNALLVGPKASLAVVEAARQK